MEDDLEQGQVQDDLFGDLPQAKKLNESSREERLVDDFLPEKISSGSLYPQAFAGVPIFAPIKSRKKLDTMGYEEKDGVHYNLPGGRLQRLGAGLDMYDEDTLIAIWQLIPQRRLVGTIEEVANRLNIFAPNTVFSGRSEFLFGTVTTYKINNFLGLNTGGDSNKKRRDSIIRLNRNNFYYYPIKNGREVGHKDLKLFYLVERTDNDNVKDNQFDILLDPWMVNLMRSYFLIDMELRKKLTIVGKALQRFLVSQSESYYGRVEKLMEDLDYRRSRSEFIRDLSKGRDATLKNKGTRPQLELMLENGFIKSWKISGGYGKEHMIEIER